MKTNIFYAMNEINDKYILEAAQCLEHKNTGRNYRLNRDKCLNNKWMTHIVAAILIIVFVFTTGSIINATTHGKIVQWITQLFGAEIVTRENRSLIGKEITEFEAQAFHENEFKTIKKEDLLGKWNVLFFYPADFTFVCPTELEDLANKYEEFKNINCEIYSVSCDTHFVHKAWHDTSKTIKKINYPMLADPTAKLAKDLDVYIEADGLAERGSFIINPEGKVVMYEVIAGNVGRNADELFRRVQASQFVYEHGDEVCPAKWKPGEETLKPSLDLVGLI